MQRIQRLASWKKQKKQNNLSACVFQLCVTDTFCVQTISFIVTANNLFPRIKCKQADVTWFR